MGCAAQKQSTKQEIKQNDTKLQQIGTVPILYDSKTNPIVKRRLLKEMQIQSESNRTPIKIQNET